MASTILNRGQMPLVAITDTFTVASQAAMLASAAQTGDIAVRSDISKSFVLKGMDPSVLANWQELLTPASTVQAGSVVQARRSTTQTLTTTSAVFPLDTIDLATNSGVCNRDAINTERLVAYVDGTYLVQFSCYDLDSNTSNLHTLRLNRNGVVIPSSVQIVSPRNDQTCVSGFAFIALAAGDYVHVSGLKSGNAGTGVISNLTVAMLRLDGLQGPAGAPGGDFTNRFTAAQLDNPTTADWAVNALAPAGALVANSSLVVRSFDDTAEEGVGGLLDVPVATTTLGLTLKCKAVSAQATGRGAVFKLYCRPIKDGAALPAWTSVQFTAIFDATANFRYFNFQTTLASLGILPGEFVQFELTRVGSNVADTIVGDVALVQLVIGFS